MTGISYPSIQKIPNPPVEDKTIPSHLDSEIPKLTPENLHF